MPKKASDPSLGFAKLRSLLMPHKKKGERGDNPGCTETCGSRPRSGARASRTNGGRGQTEAKQRNLGAKRVLLSLMDADLGLNFEAKPLDLGLCGDLLASDHFDFKA